MTGSCRNRVKAALATDRIFFILRADKLTRIVQLIFMLLIRNFPGHRIGFVHTHLKRPQIHSFSISTRKVLLVVLSGVLLIFAIVFSVDSFNGIEATIVVPTGDNILLVELPEHSVLAVHVVMIYFAFGLLDLSEDIVAGGHGEFIVGGNWEILAVRVVLGSVFGVLLLVDNAHVDLVHVDGGRVQLLEDFLVNQRAVNELIIDIDSRSIKNGRPVLPQARAIFIHLLARLMMCLKHVSTLQVDKARVDLAVAVGLRGVGREET